MSREQETLRRIERKIDNARREQAAYAEKILTLVLASNGVPDYAEVARLAVNGCKINDGGLTNG